LADEERRVIVDLQSWLATPVIAVAMTGVCDTPASLDKSCGNINTTGVNVA